MLHPDSIRLEGERVVLRATQDEDAYREAMRRSHRELEPTIYPAALDFRFHPGKVLVDILSRGDGSRLGGFSLHGFREDVKSCELGYWISPEAQGHGFMFEASALLVDWLFADASLERLSLICDRRNERSIRLALRLGFQHEGYLKGFDVVTDEPVVKLLFARYA